MRGLNIRVTRLSEEMAPYSQYGRWRLLGTFSFWNGSFENSIKKACPVTAGQTSNANQSCYVGGSDHDTV